VYGRRGEIDRAVAELELALEYDRTNLLALKNLSLAYANLGRRDEARDLLRRALAINPAQEDLREALRLLEQPR
ncbi:MAG: tetratricopeptide repeat protein, partial [Proteobacteria bacterium]|nr:tetratricopeptide repeat protein [Pseudomonadota bacterium]